MKATTRAEKGAGQNTREDCDASVVWHPQSAAAPGAPEWKNEPWDKSDPFGALAIQATLAFGCARAAKGYTLKIR
jgi:hypothetical protein